MNNEDKQLLDRLDGFLDATIMCLSNDSLGNVTKAASAIVIEKTGSIIDSIASHICFEDDLLAVCDVKIKQLETEIKNVSDVEESLQKKLPTTQEKQVQLAWHIVDMLRILTEDKNVLSIGEYQVSDIVTFQHGQLKYQTNSHAFVTELPSELILMSFDERNYLIK